MINIEGLRMALGYIVEDDGLEPELLSEEAEDILDELKALEEAGKLDFKNLKPVLDEAEALKDYLYSMGEDTYAEMIGDAILDITIDASFDESGKGYNPGYDVDAEDVLDSEDLELDEFLEEKFNDWYDNQEFEDIPMEFNLELAYEAGSKLAGYHKFDKKAYGDTEECFKENGLEPDPCDMFKAGYIDHYEPERI